VSVWVSGVGIFYQTSHLIERAAAKLRKSWIIFLQSTSLVHASTKSRYKV